MLFTETHGSRKAFSKDPAVIRFKDTYFLYYSSYYADGEREALGIGVASSPDMEHWTTVGRIPPTQECEKNGIGAPAAILLEGKVHLFYQSYGNARKDAICHAVSSDGIGFEKDPTNPVFRPTEDWCIGRAIDADVVVFRNRLFLYFATRDHSMTIQKLGAAYAELGGDYSRGAWKQAAERSILYPEYEWEGACIEAPATVVHNEKVYMFYGGAYNCTPQQIGAAVSDDGINFRKLFGRPFIAAGKEGEWNSSESGHPYVFTDDDGKTYLFYQGSGDMGKSWYITKCRIGFKDGLPFVCGEDTGAAQGHSMRRETETKGFSSCCFMYREGD